MINNPYQTTPMMNNYVPQFGAYNYNPMANMQRYQQQEVQQVQQTIPQQIAGINGRVVQTAENINANEVPMDGSMAFFPKQDLSEIYVKGWDANGLIKTIVYKPYTEPKNNQAVNSMSDTEKLKIDLSEKATEGIITRFDNLEEKLTEIERLIGSTTAKSSTKTSSKPRNSSTLVQD